MAKTCRAEWCVSLAMDGSEWCAIHAKAPPLHNLERQKDWRRRTALQKAAATREAARIAASDAAMAKRRGGA